MDSLSCAMRVKAILIWRDGDSGGLAEQHYKRCEVCAEHREEEREI